MVHLTISFSLSRNCLNDFISSRLRNIIYIVTPQPWLAYPHCDYVSKNLNVTLAGLIPIQRCLKLNPVIASICMVQGVGGCFWPFKGQHVNPKNSNCYPPVIDWARWPCSPHQGKQITKFPHRRLDLLFVLLMYCEVVNELGVPQNVK